MRIWTISPAQLDRAGLVALWREALLAQAVLSGKTRGYKNHSQLDRFKALPDPVGSIAHYLRIVYAEAVRRGYRFDAERILPRAAAESIPVTAGQVEYELEHLRRKLAARDPSRLDGLRADVHPLFYVVPGPVEPWERVA